MPTYKKKNKKDHKLRHKMLNCEISQKNKNKQNKVFATLGFPDRTPKAGWGVGEGGSIILGQV